MAAEMSVEEILEAAVSRHEAGELDEAENLYRQILLRQPEDADALQMLGVLALQRGDPRAALELIERSLALNPTAPECHYHHGVVLTSLGRGVEGVAALRRAIDLKPDYVEACHCLAAALLKNKEFDGAIALLRRVVEQRPDDADALHGLGDALQAKGEFEPAIDAYRRAAAARPDFPEVFFGWASALRCLGRLDETIATYRQAISLRPTYVEAMNNLAGALKDVGEVEQALKCYEQALAIRPNFAAAHSNRLFTMHFQPDADARTLFEAHRAWAQGHAGPPEGGLAGHRNDRSPDRRLRIGYVSGDFRSHPVGLALEPILEQHDRRQFEIAGFSNVPTPDALTQRIQSKVDQWHPIFGSSDAQVVELIRQQQIDVLVDLSLHMAHNRLLVFACKPAPVQVTYLGYPSTTGLSTIDYRLTDPYLDPPGIQCPYYSEQSIRLPKTYLCWRWSGQEEPVEPLPALRNGYVTFGSLNNFCKVTTQVLQCWGRLLSEVKDSRLILRCPAGGASARVQQILSQWGVGPQRVELTGRLAWDQYVSLCSRQDIGLDPFPYPGHTTSLDSLWMGVPLVTLGGSTAVSRGGVSILSNLGLPQLIAQNVEQYIDIAASLAADLPRLVELRAGLRRRIEQSPLMDAAGFTRDLEAAYRQMWRTWCATRF